MLGIAGFGWFVVAVFLLNITPGPDTAYIVGRSVAQGRLAGLVSAWGISAGCCVHMVAGALGVTALLAASATAFTVIKFAGAAYLIYLGLRMLVARAGSAAADATTPPLAAPRSLRSVFGQGFLTNVLNPKVVLFFIAFFPQFVNPASPHPVLAWLVLGSVFVLMSTLWNSGVAWLAGTLTAGLAARRSVQRWLERSVGLAFVGLGLKLALTRR